LHPLTRKPTFPQDGLIKSEHPFRIWKLIGHKAPLSNAPIHASKRGVGASVSRNGFINSKSSSALAVFGSIFEALCY